MVDGEVVVQALLHEMRGTQPKRNQPVAALLEAYRKADHPLGVIAGERPPNRDQLGALVDLNIGTSYDEKGNKIWPSGSGEEERHDAAKKIVEILSNFQEGKIDALVNNNTVMLMVESIIRQDPSVAAQYDSLNKTEQEKWIRGLLSNRTTREEVIRLLSERAGVNKLIQDEVIKLQQEKLSLNKQRQELESQINALDVEIKAQRDAYEETKSTVDSSGFKEGELVSQLKTLKGEAESARQKVSILRREVDNLSNLINEAERARSSSIASTISRTDIAPDFDERIKKMNDNLDSLRNERDDRMKQLNDAQKTLAEREVQIKAVEANEKLNESIQRLENFRQELIKKLANINGELATIDPKLKKQLAERLIKETEFIASLASIIPEAVAKTMNERLDQLNELQKKIEEEAVVKAKSELEREVRNNILNAYRDAQGRIDWDQVKAAWDLFLKNGVDGLLEGDKNVSELLPSGITLDQLKEDKDTYEAIAEAIKQKMSVLRVTMPRGKGPLARLVGFLRGPKPISYPEALNIIDSLGEEYLQKITQTNKGVQKAISDIAGAGMLDSRGRISRRLRGLPLGLLLLILPLILGAGFLFKRW